MRNFEKNFDRLLNNLKEATTILKECNAEMTEVLNKSKTNGFVVVDENGLFYKESNTFVDNLNDAKIFASRLVAEQIAKDLNEDCAEYNQFVGGYNNYVTAIVKVVE